MLIQAGLGLAQTAAGAYGQYISGSALAEQRAEAERGLLGERQEFMRTEREATQVHEKMERMKDRVASRKEQRYATRAASALEGQKHEYAMELARLNAKLRKEAKRRSGGGGNRRGGYVVYNGQLMNVRELEKQALRLRGYYKVVGNEVVGHDALEAAMRIETALLGVRYRSLKAAQEAIGKTDETAAPDITLTEEDEVKVAAGGAGAGYGDLPEDDPEVEAAPEGPAEVPEAPEVGLSAEGVPIEPTAAQKAAHERALRVDESRARIQRDALLSRGSKGYAAEIAVKTSELESAKRAVKRASDDANEEFKSLKKSQQTATARTRIRKAHKIDERRGDVDKAHDELLKVQKGRAGLYTGAGAGGGGGGRRRAMTDEERKQLRVFKGKVKDKTATKSMRAIVVKKLAGTGAVVPEIE